SRTGAASRLCAPIKSTSQTAINSSIAPARGWSNHSRYWLRSFILKNFNSVTKGKAGCALLLGFRLHASERHARMANGQSERVGCVVRFDDIVMPEQFLNGYLNKSLVCSPEAGQVQFDLHRRVLERRPSHCGSGFQNNAPSLGNGHESFGVFEKEN